MPHLRFSHACWAAAVSGVWGWGGWGEALRVGGKCGLVPQAPVSIALLHLNSILQCILPNDRSASLCPMDFAIHDSKKSFSKVFSKQHPLTAAQMDHKA